VGCLGVHGAFLSVAIGARASIQRVLHRRVEQIWQAYRRDGAVPVLKNSGTPKKESLSKEDAELILKAYGEFKVNALTLEKVLKHNYGKALPHNRIHAVLRKAGRALPQPSKQKRWRWIRYEREHSMSLWHTDWKPLPDDWWWIAYLDDASRLVVSQGVFKEATTDNSISVLERAIAKYGCPREILTDRGTQFYASHSEGERKEKGISRFEAQPGRERDQAYPLPRPASSNKREAGKVLRSIRPEKAPIQGRRRVRPLA
ncbi:MAG: DDE-type integrase/transposase/recombinase, partial [Thermoproteota archaeon]